MINKVIIDCPVVCFVGISSKPGKSGPLKALASETLSGKIVSAIETRLRSSSNCRTFARDNLVRIIPLTGGRLRYPTVLEMEKEWNRFQRRLRHRKANIVVLLGNLVANFFRSQHNIQMINSRYADRRFLKWTGVDESGRAIIAIAHPSYVGIYARKHIGAYGDALSSVVQQFVHTA